MSMLATAERIHPRAALGTVEILWHRPVDPDACDGDCDYHSIICGQPGISVPGGVTDVPEKLTEPGQRWCTACLTGQSPAAVPTAPAAPGREAAVVPDETATGPRAEGEETRSVRVHGGRVDHTAREQRPGRWRTVCGSLPVDPRDFERARCGTPCRACARALRRAADPGAAAARAHAAAVRRREAAGQAPLPESTPRPTAADLAHEENPAS
ncbi:hypothetical protein ACFWNK_30825 [Streptomyces sp. NPDC058417]|uniref:hypothetical protein n=1 Tax=unclassified Streptomyces TaxID=2593676 RepID=UPI003655F3EB